MMHGVLNIYKEKGFTSHDVVAKLRRITGQKKIGHTGTLDPEAEGVLPVCLGKATRLCDMLTDKDKTYETVLLLGQATDTQDCTGKILTQKDTSFLTEDQVKAEVLSFQGEYEQIPPMYSALKINGKKLYELARDGKEVERKPRKVRIHQIRILDVSLPRVRMEVTCSKGTYIRTLCQDIGEKLGCGGCMESLVRTRVERFTREEGLTLAQAGEEMEAGTLAARLVPVDRMLDGRTRVYLKPAAAKAVRNGNPFWPGDILWQGENHFQDWQDKEEARVYDENRNFIAVYAWQEAEQYFKIVKMFFDRPESDN